jgi:hypothetical protein
MKTLALLLIWLLAGLLQAVGGGEQIVEVGGFSTATPGTELPDNWKPLTFKKIPRHTTYALVRDGARFVIKADSETASSGLVREIIINPKDYPIVQWSWKVTNLIQKSNVRRKDGDDYSARLYITFEYDSTKVGFFDKAKYEAARLLYGQYPPLAAINYIWATNEPKGSIVPNPYTDRTMMVVVESGQAQLNHWITEERNIVADYQQAFGQEPPMISGVAIMTDTDNTKESVTAYYGDIIFRQQRP